MYKVKDLKKLKKNELVDIAETSKLQVTDKLTKAQVIDKFVETGICQPLPVAVVEVELPVEFGHDCLCYRVLTDDKLHTIPDCSFVQLYTYCCGANESSMKSLDRAAEHASAGDIACVKLCHVSITL